MRRLLLALAMLALPLGAQTLYIVNPAGGSGSLYAPQGSYQTVSAIVNGANDKTVTWSFVTAGSATLVGTNPSTENGTATIAVHDTAAETVVVKATSNANGSVTGTSTIVFTASPTPLTTHPRFIFTAANLAAQQAKAGGTIGSAIRSQQLYNFLNARGGIPADNVNFSWSCNSGTGTIIPNANVTNLVISGGTLTAVTSTNTLPAGEPVQLNGLSGSYAFLNGSIVTTATVSGTSFTATVPYGNVATASQSGTVTLTLLGDYQLSNVYGYMYLGMIDPSDATYHWSCYAHDILMTIINEYMSNQNTNVPGSWWFTYVCNPGCSANPTANQNEWSDPSYTVPLYDWLISSGTMSSGDLTTVRAFFAYIAQTVINNQGSPPTTGLNSSAMLTWNNQYSLAAMRATGNNYNESRILWLAAIGATFNDNTTDDPPLANTCSAAPHQVCPDGTAGSLHAYLYYDMGAYQYQYWGAVEDPVVAQQAYNTAYANLPTQPQCENTDAAYYNCFGVNREGEPSEGSFYGYAQYHTVETGNILRTAGLLDPLVFGPQVSLFNSSFWDLRYIDDLAFLTGPTTHYTPGVTQPAFYYTHTGDTYTAWVTPTNASVEAELTVTDSETGRTDRTNALVWYNLWMPSGGPAGTLWGCTTGGGILCGYDAQLQNGNYIVQTIYPMYFSQPASDPVSSVPADPRPSLPTDIFNNSFTQHTTIRNNYTSSGTLFTSWFDNSMYNHEYEYDGRFDIFANGEYITVARTTYNDYNQFMALAYNVNSLSIVNSIGTGGCAPQALNGGQFPLSSQAGLVFPQHSELPTYVASIGNTTNAYNGNSTNSVCNGQYTFTDVTAASRSMVYLRGSNQIVTYDRAQVGHAASTQNVTINTTGTPTITSNTASWLTQSATQKAYYTSLLPASATMTNIGLLCSSANNCNAGYQVEDWELVSQVQVTPPGTPTNSQFLNVLEWGASGFSKSATTLVQSTGGQAFDGSLIGTSLVMFMRAWPATFTSTTFAASGATAVYVSDLTPGTSYAISGAGAPTSGTTDTAGVLAFAAGGSGNITVGSGSSSGGVSFGGNATLGGGVIIQ